MNQLSLFDNGFKTFYEKIQDVIDDIIVSHRLPDKSIHIYSNISAKGKNAGKETSKSICIFEPEYPRRIGKNEIPGRNCIILNILKIDPLIEIRVKKEQLDSLDVPASAIVKTQKSEPGWCHLIFEPCDESVYKFIRQSILYCLVNYESSNSFGCCSRFVECSDAKECVHENKIYSMGCKYRKNLDMGKIFYGKNRNVD